jgi:MOSC domain-containing protein YiiM
METQSANGKTIIDQVFIGGRSALPPEGQPTGIYKRAAAGRVELGGDGLAGDVQADRRVHGGPEKALHHYPAEHYTALAAAFAQVWGELVPGSLGENVTTVGLDEETVCIGDVFRVGGVRIQVSQPRSPCWKIDCKFAATGMARLIAERGITGWYYRVLAPGSIGAGDTLELLDRNAEPVSLSRLWRAQIDRRPAIEELHQLARTPGLAPGWAKKLTDRIDWLRRNPELDFG